MPRRVIPTHDVDTTPAYSHVVRAGDLLVVSGQTAQDKNGALVGPGDSTAQATQAFENLRQVLASADANPADVIKLTIFVTRPDVRQAAVQQRNAMFDEPRPASTYLIVAGLASPDFLIEVEAMAWLGA